MQHSNLQEENIDQLYENIDQWKKAYETLKEQYQNEEKVTTCDDGRPSHVSIQLFGNLNPLILGGSEIFLGLLYYVNKILKDVRNTFDVEVKL